MNIFKPITLKWRQTALFKISLVALGIIIGSAWPSLAAWDTLLWILVIVPGLYIFFIWSKQ